MNAMQKRLIWIAVAGAAMFLCLFIGIKIGVSGDEALRATETSTEIPIASTKAPVIVKQPTATAPSRSVKTETIFDFAGVEAQKYLNDNSWDFYWDYEYDAFYDDNTVPLALFSIYTDSDTRNGNVSSVGFSWIALQVSPEALGSKAAEFADLCGILGEIEDVWDYVDIELYDLLDEAYLASDQTAHTTWNISGYEIQLSVALEGPEFEDSMMILHIFEN
jgi:hypothetical protein